jgi:leader peptidase (prepilin peptidase) / N-methyltransferase
MDILPAPLLITIVFLLGSILGSFLDVVVTRFHTGKSINGRSRCLSCGHTLSWYELFPFLSYLILRGRCRNCGASIPKRLIIMEVTTAFLFVYVYLFSGPLIFLFLNLVLICLLLVIAVYDIDHLIIPHEFVIVLLALCTLMLFLMYRSTDIFVYIPHLISAFMVSLFYGGLWLISKGKWIGLGDAKLAFPLGLLLAPYAAFSMIVLSFWIGAAISVGVLFLQRALQSGKHRLPILSTPLTMKSEVPFAPFMIVAFVLVFFQNIDVLAVMARLF